MWPYLKCIPLDFTDQTLHLYCFYIGVKSRSIRYIMGGDGGIQGWQFSLNQTNKEMQALFFDLKISPSSKYQ